MHFLRVTALAALAFVGLVTATGCETTEHAVLIEALSTGDIQTLDVLVTTVAPSGDVGDRVHWVKGRPIGRSATSILEEPIRIAVSLPGDGDYMVTVVGYGPAGRYAATRCYAVSGIARDKVTLINITEADVDGDGFVLSPGDFCIDPTDDGSNTACKNACAGGADIDCDDGDGAVFPGAPEVCADDFDQDCDSIDEPCTDEDGDDYPACGKSSPAAECDCDDANPDINPAATNANECTSGFDENCDGMVEVCDMDGDGAFSCAPGDSAADCDCNDGDETIKPGVKEVCTEDGEIAVDENCNGRFDEGCLPDDLDGDTFVDCDLTNAALCDCNDCNPGVFPGADENCGDGIDDNCDGSDEPCLLSDTDKDGYGDDDCDNADGLIHPGAEPSCGTGEDRDCTGGVDPACATDADGDGYDDGSADCDSQSDAISPAATEICDNFDNDCDGVVNEVQGTDTGCAPADAIGCGLGNDYCEIDFATSLDHCGGCRVACDPATSNACKKPNASPVSAAACVCDAALGTYVCASDGLCLNRAEDDDACGAGCVDCTAISPPARGDVVCNGGTCTPICVTAGESFCDDDDNPRCANKSNVTSCGNACVNCEAGKPDNAVASCVGGACDYDCMSGTLCSDMTACVDQTLTAHCGPDCDNCADNLRPANSSPTCDGTSCGWACDGGFKQCGNTCVPELTSTCPSLGAATCSVCAPGTGEVNGSCAGSTCNYACDEANGYADCAGTCRDTRGDTNHCGGCNVQCAPGETCNNGRCDCDGSTQDPAGSGPFCSDSGDECCPGQMPRCQNSCD